MFIEFAGMPGSGKSSLREAFLLFLQKDKKYDSMSFEQAFFVSSKANIDKIYRIFLKCLPENLGFILSNKLVNRSLMQFEAQCRFLSKHGSALNVFLTSQQYALMTVEDRETVISTFLQVGSMYECIAERFPKKTRIVLDEGFVQKSFMFVFPGIECVDARNPSCSYLKQVPLPDVVIWVKTDIETCYDRLLKRPRGFTDRLRRLGTPERMKDFLSASESHLEEICMWLRANTSTKIIDVANNESVERGMNELCRHTVQLNQ